MAPRSNSVSIVIPTFNRAKLVDKAIESALAQTVGCEVVVSDHGSKDETSAVVRGFGDRVCYVRREEDRGPIFAWLDGVINASGEFIHITYDDDWIEPSFIEETLSLMTDETAFVMTDAEIHGADASYRLYEHLFPTGLHGSRSVEKFLLDSPLTVSPGCALLRRDDVLRALTVDADHYRGAGPDLRMFLIALSMRGKFGFIDRPLAHFREHRGSITVDAHYDAMKLQQLVAAYTAVKKEYLALKWARKSRVIDIYWTMCTIKRAWARLGTRVATRVRHGLGFIVDRMMSHRRDGDADDAIDSAR